MKKLETIGLPIMLLGLVLVFFACNILHTGEEDKAMGSITISIGSGNARGIWDTWPDGNLSDGVAPSMLTHLITVIPNGGDPLSRVIEGNGSVSFNLPVGHCTIVVEGMGPDNVVYSFGSRTVDIVRGVNPPAPISMGPRKMTKSITVLKNPTNPSYQGCAPDLTGIVVEIGYDDGTSSITTDTTKFSTIPERCEEWLPPEASELDRRFTLYYRGARCAFVLPEVVGLIFVNAVGAGDCYEDNLFAGIALEGDYLSSTGQRLRRPISFFTTNDAWINIDKNTKMLEYTVANNTKPSPLQPQGAITIALLYTDYYQVDKVEYISGNVTPFTAETAPLQDSVWLMALNDVKLLVIYYSEPSGKPSNRIIGMAEYRAAQNLKKASKITITNSAGSSMTWAEMAKSPDIEITARLSYYGSNINPDTGELYPPSINDAIVPITNSLYIFDRIEKVRKDNTGTTGNPQALVNRTTARDLLNSLLTYWNVEAVYKSKVNPNATPITRVYPADKWTVDGMTGFDVSAPQGGKETRSVGVRFELPESSIDDWRMIYFEYDVLP